MVKFRNGQKKAAKSSHPQAHWPNFFGKWLQYLPLLPPTIGKGERSSQNGSLSTVLTFSPDPLPKAPLEKPPRDSVFNSKSKKFYLMLKTKLFFLLPQSIENARQAETAFKPISMLKECPGTQKKALLKTQKVVLGDHFLCQPCSTLEGVLIIAKPA